MRLELKKIYKLNLRFDNGKEQEALNTVGQILDDIDYSIRQQDGSLSDFFQQMYESDILDFIQDLALEPEGRLSDRLTEYLED
jgi:hypothetical protein